MTAPVIDLVPSLDGVWCAPPRGMWTSEGRPYPWPKPTMDPAAFRMDTSARGSFDPNHATITVNGVTYNLQGGYFR